MFVLVGQVALPDCDVGVAASDIVASFSGCCGQRCMAASVLLLVGEQPDLVKLIVDKSAALKPGTVRGDRLRAHSCFPSALALATRVASRASLFLASPQLRRV